MVGTSRPVPCGMLGLWDTDVSGCAGPGRRAAGSGPRVCNTRGSVCHRERAGRRSGDRECAGWDTVGVGGRWV